LPFTTCVVVYVVTPDALVVATVCVTRGPVPVFVTVVVPTPPVLETVPTGGGAGGTSW
jgi:hypothetical protein